jgi:signal transduction histidine kinase
VVASRRPLVVVVAVVLLSSAGLLVAGLVSLWLSARAAERETAVATERSAAADARALRTTLRDPALATSRVATGESFRIAAGRLELPPGFHWRSSPPPEDPELELPIALLARVRGAEAAERDGDAARAAAEFAAAVAAAAELPPKQARWVDLVSAWAAQRRGDAAERDARLDRLLAGARAAEGFSPDGWYRSVVAGTVLLAAKAQRRLADEPANEEAAWRAAFAALEPAELAALLLELQSEAGESRAAELRAIAAPVVAQRHVLASVDPLVPRLASAREPVLEALADELLLYFPDVAPGGGQGALVPPRELVAAAPDGGGRFLLGGAREAASGTGADSLSDAIPVVPLISIVPATAPPAGLFAGRQGLAVLIVLLAATFGVGLAVALRMVRREVELTAARARFLTNVTHELKTPLASIRLFAEMLLEGRVESEAKRGEYHRLLAGESERLSALIENVLDLGRLERGERALDLEPRRIDELTREILERIAPLAARDGLAIATRGLDVACEASCDRGALAQALVNLLDNSRKYAAAGGKVEVALERDSGVARLSVRDFGPGIPEEERERIFEPFVRGERQRDGSIPGLGLGLHLARSLLRAQHGELRCTSPQDGGAGVCFVAELPLHAGNEARNGAKNGAAP